MTAWSIVGFTGSGLFASRWLLQLLSSKRAGRPVVTWSFWAISMGGSLLQVAYFGLGPHFDEVGLLGNALPLCTAGYNLFLCWKLSRLASGGPLSIAAPLSERRHDTAREAAGKPASGSRLESAEFDEAALESVGPSSASA